MPKQLPPLPQKAVLSFRAFLHMQTRGVQAAQGIAEPSLIPTPPAAGPISPPHCLVFFTILPAGSAGGGAAPLLPRGLLGAQGQDQRPLCVRSPLPVLPLSQLGPSEIAPQLLASGSLQDRCHCISCGTLGNPPQNGTLSNPPQNGTLGNPSWG